MTREHPDAQAHGDISEVLPGLHFVTGSMQMKAPLPTRFSRNMTIIANGSDLTLVNTLRLSEKGLAALDQLGSVKHVIRLAGFHGVDDPFYADRYGAKVWSVDAPYKAGFGEGEPYFEAHEIVAADTQIPIPGAQFFVFQSTRTGEALLHLDRDGGVLISGDCLQNWARADRFFSLPARILMRFMGFIKAHNVGPGWLKTAKPDPAEVRSLLKLEFEHVLPAHGSPVLGNAKAHYTPTISAV